MNGVMISAVYYNKKINRNGKFIDMTTNMITLFQLNIIEKN